MVRPSTVLLALLFASVAFLAMGEPAPKKSSLEPHEPPQIQPNKAITPPPPYRPPRIQPNRAITPPPPYRPPTFSYQNPGVQAKEGPESVTPPPPRRPPGTEANEEQAPATETPHGPPAFMHQTNDMEVPKPPGPVTATPQGPPAYMYQPNMEPKPPAEVQA